MSLLKAATWSTGGELTLAATCVNELTSIGADGTYAFNELVSTCRFGAKVCSACANAYPKSNVGSLGIHGGLKYAFGT